MKSGCHELWEAQLVTASIRASIDDFMRSMLVVSDTMRASFDQLARDIRATEEQLRGLLR